MLPLLFPFLADTVIAPPPDFEDVFVNEWGVVVFTSDGSTVAGAPDENGNIYYGREPYGELMVDAPVIWIHGAFFENATLTVRANQGELTALYPEGYSTDDEHFSRTASWHISAPPPVPLLGRPEPPEPEDVPFAWAMPFWREVPSRDLFSADTDEYLGNFLYYEAGIFLWQPPDGISDAELLAGYYSTEGFAIETGDEPTVQRIQLVPLPDGTGGSHSRESLDDQEICEIICGWAGGNLKSQEIEALWYTWKPFFQTETMCDELSADRRTQGEKWIMFPLPWDEVEKISSVNLDIEGGPDRIIHYNRLFLGLVRVY